MKLKATFFALACLLFAAFSTQSHAFLLLMDKQESALAAPTVSGWENVGNSYTTSSTYAGLAPLTGDYIVSYDAGLQTIRTLSFDGTNLTLVGNALSISGLGFGNADSIIKLTSSKIVFIKHSSDHFYVFSWDGTDWSQESGPHTVPDTGGYANGGYLDDNSVVLASGSNGTTNFITRLDYNGTTFTEIGTALTTTGNYHHPVALSPTRIADINTSANTVTTYDFDGSNWTQVGNAYSLTSSGKTSGARLAEDKILAYAGNSIQALIFDGTDWSAEGSAYANGVSSWPRSMAPIESTLLTVPQVACHGYGAGGLTNVAQATLN